MKFRTKIEQGDKTATGIRIPSEVVEGLGAGKRPPVRVTIKGYTYRSSIATVSGNFMVGVSADVREKAGVAGGDVVDVEIALDTEPREVEIPADFGKALAKESKAKSVFDGLTYSLRRRYVMSIEGAKTEETRQRRIAKSIEELKSGGPKR